MLVLMGACLVPNASLAMTLKSGDGIKAPISLSGQMAILRDPTGRLTIDDLVSGPYAAKFAPISSMLTGGYQKQGAIWVRFALSAPGAQHRWLLQIERPLIEHVTLFVPDGTGHFAVSAPGHLRPGEGEGAGAYPSLFPISVPSAPTVYYVRLQSSTSISTALNVWQKDGYDGYRRTDDWIIGFVVGAVATMLFVNLLYSFWLKDSLYLLYAAVLLDSGLMAIFHMGYASELLFFLEPQWVHRTWGAIVCSYVMAMILFLARLFEFSRHWPWAWRLFQGVVLLNGIAMILALAGHYADVGFFVSRLEQVSFAAIALLVLHLLVVRRQYQYLLPAFALAGVIAVSLVMLMQYTGANPFRIDSSLARLMALGSLIHLVFLSAAVAKRTRLAERSLDAEKDRVIALSRSVEQELTIKVRERTAELADRNAALRVEMARRQLLEGKLRQSLNSVNEALTRQRDFVALVSHEFRSPLAVIAAAAENLAASAAEGAGDIRARAARIRQTVRRMSLLIENVLARDILDSGQAYSTRNTLFDLNDVLRVAEVGLGEEAAGRVYFILGPPAMIRGDRTLLEIVVQNLIQNALKYSGPTDAAAIRLSTDRGMALVEVTDHGGGVSPDDQPFIFNKYYRAAGQRARGSGLGLYIARDIARQHGGDLVLAASDAGGSTFRLSLPIAGPDSAA
jgi:signal transduction histidine kinase